MRAAVLALAVAACGDNETWVDNGECWPIDTTTPGGSVELGTGYADYAVMPVELPMVYGDQNGYHIEARGRLVDLYPGDPIEVTKLTNPRTRYSAWFYRNNDPLDGLPINESACPNRLGYVPASDGTGFTSATLLEVRFDLQYQDAEIFGKKFRVRIEVIDAFGRYAKDEKIITALPPRPRT